MSRLIWKWFYFEFPLHFCSVAIDNWEGDELNGSTDLGKPGGRDPAVVLVLGQLGDDGGNVTWRAGPS